LNIGADSGIYFTDEEHILDFMIYGKNIWKVEIPDDAQVYEKGYEFRTDKIIISDPRQFTYNEYFKAVSQNSNMLYYVPDELITEDLYVLLVKEDGYYLQSIPDELKTRKICKIAMEQNKFAAQFVPDKMKCYLC
jgi:hypothetical protein